MSEDKDDFLSRWSRRKREVAAAKQAPVAPTPASEPESQPVELPSPDSLTFESDFTAYLRSNVTESVKRAALKKLFSDPRFNVMDGLDVYIDDYSKSDPIPEEMLKTLEHARSTLFGPQTEPDRQVATHAEAHNEAPQQTAQTEAPVPAPQAGKDDGDTRQDT